MASALARHLDPAWRAQLIGSVRGHLAAGGAADPVAWCAAVDVLARRVGLLVCGDLDAAAAGLCREPAYAARTSHEERLADLICFAVSDEHARLRREVGQAID
jgi:hypothetical protein